MVVQAEFTLQDPSGSALVNDGFPPPLSMQDFAIGQFQIRGMAGEFLVGGTITQATLASANQQIPTTSTWGLLAMVLAVLAAAKIGFHRQRTRAA